MHTYKPLPNTEAELDIFLSAFEDGTYPKSDWTHAAHLVAGSSYLYALGHDAALDHMRDRVRHYNLATGGQNTPTSGYHETLTRFWFLVLDLLHQHARPTSRVAFTHLAVHHFGHRSNLHAAFYNINVVASREARASWLPPDRIPTISDLLLSMPS